MKKKLIINNKKFLLFLPLLLTINLYNIGLMCMGLKLNNDLKSSTHEKIIQEFLEILTVQKQDTINNRLLTTFNKLKKNKTINSLILLNKKKIPLLKLPKYNKKNNGNISYTQYKNFTIGLEFNNSQFISIQKKIYLIYLSAFLVITSIIILICLKFKKIDLTTTNQFKRRLLKLSSKKQKISLERNKAQLANEAKNKFLANMSHELRTPMNGIIGFSNILKKTKLDDQQMQYIDIINKSSKTLLRIINDILDFSKIKANKINLEKKVFNLKDAIKESIQLISLEAKRKNLTLTLNYNAHVLIKSDKTRIQQVISNLLMNAVKFTPKGKITVSVEVCQNTVKEKHRIKFSVEDTGIGIQLKDKKKIFKAFEQADVTTEKKYSGTGLGLIITKDIIEALGGRIHLSSQPEKGSKFFFILPLEPVDQTYTQDKTTKKNKNLSYLKTHPPLKLLAVDDNSSNLLLISTFLKQKKHQVELARSGKEAISACLNQSFHIIFMDIQMPIMDGIKAAKIIKEKCSLNIKTPIIALSAYAFYDQKKQISQSNFCDYLHKPINEDDLNNMINKWSNEPITQHNAQTVINWDDLIKITGQKESLAIDLLTMSIQEFPYQVTQIKKHLKDCEYQVITGILHKIQGTACYLGASILQNKTRTLQIQIKNKHFLTLKKELDEMFSLIDKFQNEALSLLEKKMLIEHE